MRYILLSTLILLAFSNCSTYQYLTLDSSQLSKNDKKQFVWENDTLRLIYDFNGPGGPMAVQIYNKTSQPLYVNWKKSAIIRDQHSTSLFDRNVLIDGSMGSYTFHRFGAISASTGSFTASFSLPEGVDFIPPNSAIDKGLLAIAQSGALVSVVPDSAPTSTIWDPTGLNDVRYRRVTYSEDRSPIRFNSYITFVLGSDNSREFAENHSFFVNEVVQANAEPKAFALYRHEGDALFIEAPRNKTSGSNTIVSPEATVSSDTQ